MSSVLLEARNIRKTFGTFPAVDGISLSVRAGEAYGLVGPDGAGKTTTMRLLVGALTSDGGQIEIAGYDLRAQPERARAHLGYLAQQFSLYTDLTVAENLRFFGEMRGITGSVLRQRADELLRFVGLAGFEDRLAGYLSGGMKQKLGLATALIHRPSVLLLDEPTTGVDPVTRQDFWQLIIRLLGEGTGVIVSTPFMDEAARCNRLGFMYRGRLLTEGTLRELTAPLVGRVLEIVAEPKSLARRVCLADRDVEDAIAFGDRLHLRVRKARDVLDRLPAALAEAGVRVVQLREIAPALEDVFLSLLEGAEGSHG